MSTTAGSRTGTGGLRLPGAAWVIVLTLVAFVVWWWPYFVQGKLPVAEWGYGFLWAEWLNDRLWLVLRGTLPEWNPHFGLGYNAIGFDPFYNPISIGNIFQFILRPPMAWPLGVVVFQAILSTGAFFFLRQQGIAKPVAIFFAVLLSFYPKLTGDDFGHGPRGFLSGYSWLPWLLVCAQRAFEGRRVLLNHVLAGVFAALIFLSGGALTTYFLCYLIVPFYGWQLVKTVRAPREGGLARAGVLASVAGIALSGIVACGLAAYLLAPLVDHLRLTQRSLYEGPTGYGLLDLAGMIFPWSTRMQVPQMYDQPYTLPLIGEMTNLRLYFGILALPLVALSLGDREIRRRNGFFVVLGLLLILSNTWLAIQTVSITRLVDDFVAIQPSEYFIFFSYIFCLNTAFAFAADAILARRNAVGGMAVARRLAGGLQILYGVAIAAWLATWLLVAVFPGEIERVTGPLLAAHPLRALQYVQYTMLAGGLFLDGKFVACVLAALVVRFALVALFRRSGKVALSTGLLATMAVLWIADFLLFPQTFYAFSDANKTRYAPDSVQNTFIRQTVGPLDRIAAHYPYEKVRVKTAAQERLLEDIAAKGDVRFEPRPLLQKIAAINPDLGFWQPLFDAGVSYSPQYFGRAQYNWHLSIMPSYFYAFDAAINGGNPRYYRQSWTALWDPASPLVNIAGIDYVVWYERLDDPRYELVARDPIGDVWIYRNRDALPKAYLVHQARAAASDAEAIGILRQADFAPRREVVLSDRSLDVGSLAGAPGAPAAGDSVEVTSYGATRVAAKVSTSSPAVLVVTDMYFPHWSATVDGAPAAIGRVNVAFRGIVVPAGEHEVVLEFRNPAFHLGVKVSAAFAGVTALLLLIGVRRREHRAAATTAAVRSTGPDRALREGQ
jgi:hypothetical protein